jgi:hypothetical protein
MPTCALPACRRRPGLTRPPLPSCRHAPDQHAAGPCNPRAPNLHAALSSRAPVAAVVRPSRRSMHGPCRWRAHRDKEDDGGRPRAGRWRLVAVQRTSAGGTISRQTAVHGREGRSREGKKLWMVEVGGWTVLGLAGGRSSLWRDVGLVTGQ